MATTFRSRMSILMSSIPQHRPSFWSCRVARLQKRSLRNCRSLPSLADGSSIADDTGRFERPVCYSRRNGMSDTTNRLDAFREHRLQMNERIGELGHRGINRFFRLDSATYEDAALDARTKELLGLVASTVLRCNDCIDYHLEQCVE